MLACICIFGEFGASEFSGFIEYVLWYGKLPHVVQKRGGFYGLYQARIGHSKSPC